MPWLSVGPLARRLGLPEPIPLRKYNWIARTSELATPTLILHGTRDSSAPIPLSQTLRDQHPELVTLEAFDADHTLAWNSDPERWVSVVARWINPDRVRSHTLD